MCECIVDRKTKKLSGHPIKVELVKATIDALIIKSFELFSVKNSLGLVCHLMPNWLRTIQ